jgi:hypothetical protein
MATLGEIATVRQSIMPANAKFARKKAPLHFKKDFTDFVPNAISTISEKNIILINKLRAGLIFSTKIISEKIPPAPAASKNLSGLKLQPEIAALALNSR